MCLDIEQEVGGCVEDGLTLTGWDAAEGDDVEKEVARYWAHYHLSEES